MRPLALTSCLAGMAPSARALLLPPSPALRPSGGAMEKQRRPLVALRSAIGDDGHRREEKGTLFDGVGSFFHRLFPDAPDLPSIHDVSKLASSVPSMPDVSDLMSKVHMPDINVPELLQSIPQQSEGYTNVHEFDATLGKDIEEALRLANILDAPAEPTRAVSDARSVASGDDAAVRDNEATREEQFSTFREANAAFADAAVAVGGRPQGRMQGVGRRSDGQRSRELSDREGKGALFRENNVAEWNRAATSHAYIRKEGDGVIARDATTPSMFQETNAAGGAWKGPSIAARGNGAAEGRDGHANIADVKPVAQRAAAGTRTSAHRRNGRSARFDASIARPPTRAAIPTAHVRTAIGRGEEEGHPPSQARREAARARANDARGAYDSHKEYFEGGWDAGEAADEGAAFGGRRRDFAPRNVDRRGRYNEYFEGGVGSDAKTAFSDRKRRIYITDAAHELAASLRLDVHEIFRHKKREVDVEEEGGAAIGEEDVRDYLDRRYERLFSALPTRRAVRPETSRPKRRRRRSGARYDDVQRMESGRRRRERSNFDAEDEWEALYDSWKRDEDEYGWKGSQFRQRAPAGPLRWPTQRQQQKRQQRQDAYRQYEDNSPYIHERHERGPPPALPPIASVPISRLVSHPRLERLANADPPESFDLSDFKPLSQAEFRQTYHGRPQRKNSGHQTRDFPGPRTEVRAPKGGSYDPAPSAGGADEEMK